MRKRMKGILLACALLALPALVFAQEVADTAADAVDWGKVVNAVVVAVIPAIVAGFKKLLPNVPRVVVWAMPMVFGGIIAALGEMLKAPGLDLWTGIGLGALSMVLRELVSTVKEHGVNG